MYAVEEHPHRRRRLAQAGHAVSQAIALAETNPDQAHAMVNVALRTVQDSMRYFEPFAPIFAAAVDRVRAR
jgi:hypothetical protein